MFFSASSYKDAEILLDCGINEILTSYHYINKGKARFVDGILSRVVENDGLFMTDSGAFSFFSQGGDEMYDPKHWESYIEEYCAFLEENHKSIYCAANMDLDIFVGQDVVDKWNKKYFEPLHKLLQIVYIAHGDKHLIRADDDFGVKRFKEYASKYDYVGIGSSLFKKNGRQDGRFYQLARQYRTRIHAFGWTSIPSLKEYPFFSVDSTTWLGGVRYGTTYQYDGANDKVIDYKKKYLRRKQKSLCRELGIDFDKVMQDDRIAINSLNLHNWKGFRKEFLKSANTKLKNKPVNKYII